MGAGQIGGTGGGRLDPLPKKWEEEKEKRGERHHRACLPRGGAPVKHRMARTLRPACTACRRRARCGPALPQTACPKRAAEGTPPRKQASPFTVPSSSRPPLSLPRLLRACRRWGRRPCSPQRCPWVRTAGPPPLWRPPPAPRPARWLSDRRLGRRGRTAQWREPSAAG